MSRMSADKGWESSWDEKDRDRDALDTGRLCRVRATRIRREWTRGGLCSQVLALFLKVQKGGYSGSVTLLAWAEINRE